MTNEIKPKLIRVKNTYTSPKSNLYVKPHQLKAYPQLGQGMDMLLKLAYKRFTKKP